MIRRYFIQQYIKSNWTVSIFGHHGSIHFKCVFQSIVAFFLLRLLSIVIFYLWGVQETTQRALSIMALIIYGYFIVQFLNNYLDALISSDRWLTIFRRDWFLQYSVQQFEWSNIEMISFNQHTLGDKIWNRGEIIINLDHGISFPIEYVANPQKVANTLRSQKGEYHKHDEDDIEQENHEGEDNDKFTILVETLGEVIKDYMDRWPQRWPRLH